MKQRLFKLLRRLKAGRAPASSASAQTEVFSHLYGPDVEMQVWDPNQ